MSSNTNTNTRLSSNKEVRFKKKILITKYTLLWHGRNPAARNLPELAGIVENCAGIVENCAGIENSCTGTGSDFNGSSRRNDRPGQKEAASTKLFPLLSEEIYLFVMAIDP
ncbi:unnamed protein product, partial [Adineta ricciae]